MRCPVSTSSEASPSKTFSVPDHAIFLDGYMDAVGRMLSTDTDLVTLTARSIISVSEAEAILGVQFGSRTAVDNWSKEFGGLVENQLGVNQRSRLGFYLVEYICWFKEFGGGAVCFKVDCALGDAATTMQAVYFVELPANHLVLIVAKRSGKSPNTSLERT
jgi:hypothetical protein